MLTNLKKIYSSILNERYADYSTLANIKKSIKDAYDQQKDNVLYAEEVAKIYELEYKLFRLSLEKRKAGGWLPDTANMRVLKWKTALVKQLTESTEKLAQVIEGWAKAEELRFMIAERYPGGAWQFKEDVIAEMYERGIEVDDYELEKGNPEYDKVAKELKDKFFDHLWTEEEPYKTVEKTLKALQKGVPKDISSGIIMFHKGLTTAHNNGKILDYALKWEPPWPYPVKFLDNLSNGVYIPKWDEELKKRNLVSEGLVTEADLPTKHPSPEEIISAINSL